MPYKVNQSRRHNIPKVRYRVQNWSTYDAALRRRGDLTIWMTLKALAAWTPPHAGQRVLMRWTTSRIPAPEVPCDG